MKLNELNGRRNYFLFCLFFLISASNLTACSQNDDAADSAAPPDLQTRLPAEKSICDEYGEKTPDTDWILLRVRDHAGEPLQPDLVWGFIPSGGLQNITGTGEIQPICIDENCTEWLVNEDIVEELYIGAEWTRKEDDFCDYSGYATASARENGVIKRVITLTLRTDILMCE